MSKVILTHEVSGLGSAGDVVEVKGGYARNFLIPKGFATVWTRGGEKQVDQIKAARKAREIATVEEAQSRKAALEAAPIVLTATAGKAGRLFGAVKTADVAAAVAKAGLGDIDKRKVEIATAIKALGEYVATVRLHDEVSAALTLKIVAAK